LLISILQIIK